MAGISSITSAGISCEFKGTCNNTQTGAAYTGQSSTVDIRKSLTFGTSLGNAASGGGDELFSFQAAIGGGGSLTQDLTAMTNLLAQTSVSIVRIKGLVIRLLSGVATGASAADDTTITTPAATSILVTNNGPAVPAQLSFGNGGSGLVVNLTVGGGVVTSATISVAGSGYPPSATFTVSPNQAGGAGCVLAVTTNGSGVPTTVALVAGAGGTGYANAAVPTTVLGQQLVNTGGAYVYADPLAAGFATGLGATSKNVKVFNMDAANTATVEFNFLACTS